MDFNQPAPVKDTRKQQLITLRPSLKAQIEGVRGKMTRSEWIEIAIREKLARDG